jgi:hypothetical protein
MSNVSNIYCINLPSQSGESKMIIPLLTKHRCSTDESKTDVNFTKVGGVPITREYCCLSLSSLPACTEYIYSKEHSATLVHHIKLILFTMFLERGEVASS